MSRRGHRFRTGGSQSSQSPDYSDDIGTVTTTPEDATVSLYEDNDGAVEVAEG